MFLDSHNRGFKQDISIEGINDKNLNEIIELIIKNQNTIISEANKKLRKKLSRINLLLEIASLNSQYKQ